MALAALSLGSNLEPREGRLREAVRRLRAAPFGLTALSALYETQPEDVPDQPAFLNLAAVLETPLGPLELLRALQGVEAEAGKKIVVRRGPRTLDLDLLLYDGAAIESEALTVPHPAMARRAFVLVPLAELAPEWPHPVDGRTVRELRDALPADGPWVRKLASTEGW